LCVVERPGRVIYFKLTAERGLLRRDRHLRTLLADVHKLMGAASCRCGRSVASSSLR
jgi:hypothetical protein